MTRADKGRSETRAEGNLAGKGSRRTRAELLSSFHNNYSHLLSQVFIKTAQCLGGVPLRGGVHGRRAALDSLPQATGIQGGVHGDRAALDSLIPVTGIHQGLGPRPRHQCRKAVLHSPPSAQRQQHQQHQNHRRQLLQQQRHQQQPQRHKSCRRTVLHTLPPRRHQQQPLQHHKYQHQHQQRQ